MGVIIGTNDSEVQNATPDTCTETLRIGRIDRDWKRFLSWSVSLGERREHCPGISMIANMTELEGRHPRLKLVHSSTRWVDLPSVDFVATHVAAVHGMTKLADGSSQVSYSAALLLAVISYKEEVLAPARTGGAMVVTRDFEVTASM